MENQTEFEPLLRRVRVLMGVLAAAGFLVSWAFAGLRFAASYALGSAASWLSFWLLDRMTHSLETAARGGRVSNVRVALLSLRFLLIGGALYAILRFYEVSRPALAAGLMLSVVAVTLANLYDWFRT